MHLLAKQQTVKAVPGFESLTLRSERFRTLRSDMADIGKRIKKITVTPERDPDPTYVPPDREPVQPKEPAKVCAPVQS